MEAYSILAKYYDSLMKDFNYDAYLDFIKGYVKGEGVDLCCGTGEMTIRLAKQKCKIGEITDVSYEPQKEEEFDSDGNIVYAEVPNKYTLKVTILSEGKESENGYYVGNDTELAVGSTVSLATKYANSTGKVRSIEKLQ